VIALEVRVWYRTDGHTPKSGGMNSPKITPMAGWPFSHSHQCQSNDGLKTGGTSSISSNNIIKRKAAKEDTDITDAENAVS